MTTQVIPPLTTPEVFAWGALGAFCSYLVVFALPELLRLRKETNFAFSFIGLLAAIGVGAIFVFVGGVLTMAYATGSDATEFKQPLAYGLGVEGILGGTLKAFTQ